MLTVKNILGQKVTVDQDLNIAGNNDLKEQVKSIIEEFPATVRTSPALVFFYRTFTGMGFEVSAAPGDLEEISLPAESVS